MPPQEKNSLWDQRMAFSMSHHTLAVLSKLAFHHFGMETPIWIGLHDYDENGLWTTSLNHKELSLEDNFWLNSEHGIKGQCGALKHSNNGG